MNKEYVIVISIVYGIHVQPTEHTVAYFEHCGYHCTDVDRAYADEMNNLM